MCICHHVYVKITRGLINFDVMKLSKVWSNYPPINCYYYHPNYIYNIKNYWVRLLSYYNIKYICTIYTRLDTCLIYISRFSLRDKVTLRLLKLHFHGADVVEWSRALDVMLSDLCCSVSMAWAQISSREEYKFYSSKIYF